jgi:hypothetical protein
MLISWYSYGIIYVLQPLKYALVGKLVDPADLKSSAQLGVRVRVPMRAQYSHF